MEETEVTITLDSDIDGYLYILDQEDEVVYEGDGAVDASPRQHRPQFAGAQDRALVNITLPAGQFFVVAATLNQGLAARFQLRIEPKDPNAKIILSSIDTGFENYASLRGCVYDAQTG